MDLFDGIANAASQHTYWVGRSASTANWKRIVFLGFMGFSVVAWIVGALFLFAITFGFIFLGTPAHFITAMIVYVFVALFLVFSAPILAGFLEGF